MAEKYYAAKNGQNGADVYDRWESCKAQAHGAISWVF